MQEKPAERSKQLSVTVSQLRVSLAEGAHQLSQVLHRSNEQILDRLLPESAPTGAFEPVTVRSVGKATLYQVLSSFEVCSSRLGVSDFASRI